MHRERVGLVRVHLVQQGIITILEESRASNPPRIRRSTKFKGFRSNDATRCFSTRTTREFGFVVVTKGDTEFVRTYLDDTLVRVRQLE